VTDDRERLVPLLSARSRRLWDALLEHPDAPLWNAQAGDKVVAEDLEVVDAFRARIAAPRTTRGDGPPPEIVAFAEHACREVPLLRARTPHGAGASWSQVPTTSREDLALRPELLVPDDADLSRLIVHSTSGTTGHAVVVPMTPRSLALSQAILERVLATNGVPFDPGPGAVAVTHLCARRDTFVFPAIFSVWRGAGFAKVNLDDRAWPGGRAAARRFATAWPAPVATGDPVAFAEALDWDLPLATKAFVSTSFRTDPELAARLERTYGARVIDWYSLTETGPIAASAPGVEGHVVVAPDLYVEALDEHGAPVPEGALGEITVSGGRNPLFPLVRYRTGDAGRVVRVVRPDGSVETHIRELAGRLPVVFRDADGRPVASVDVTRALRAAGRFAHHEIVQREDRSVAIRVRPVPGVAVDTAALATAIRGVLGVEVVATSAGTE